MQSERVVDSVRSAHFSRHCCPDSEENAGRSQRHYSSGRDSGRVLAGCLNLLPRIWLAGLYQSSRRLTDILPMKLTGRVACKDLLITVVEDGPQWDYANGTLLSWCVEFAVNRKGCVRTSVCRPNPNLAISSTGHQFTAGTEGRIQDTIRDFAIRSGRTFRRMSLGF